MARDFGSDTDQFDVTVAQHALINNTFDGGGTVTCWLYPRSAGESNNGRIIDKGENQGDGWTILIGNAGGRFEFRHTFTGGTATSPGSNLTFNQWQFVAIVYDNSSNDNDPDHWIDESKTTPAFAPSGTVDADAARNLFIGSRDGNARWSDGIIAEVAIWKGVSLADNEIVALARGVNAQRVRPTSLSLYMPLWGIQSPEINLVSGGLSGSLDGPPTRAVEGPPVEPYSARLWGTTPLIEVAAAGNAMPMAQDHYHRRRSA